MLPSVFIFIFFILLSVSLFLPLFAFKLHFMVIFYKKDFSFAALQPLVFPVVNSLLIIYLFKAESMMCVYVLLSF